MDLPLLVVNSWWNELSAYCIDERTMALPLLVVNIWWNELSIDALSIDCIVIHCQGILRESSDSSKTGILKPTSLLNTMHWSLLFISILSSNRSAYSFSFFWCFAFNTDGIITGSINLPLASSSIRLLSDFLSSFDELFSILWIEE